MQEGAQRERGNVRDGGTASRSLPAAETNDHRTEKASRSMVSATGVKARLANMTTHVGHCTTPEGKVHKENGVPGRPWSCAPWNMCSGSVPRVIAVCWKGSCISDQGAPTDGGLGSLISA